MIPTLNQPSKNPGSERSNAPASSSNSSSSSSSSGISHLFPPYDPRAASSASSSTSRRVQKMQVTGQTEGVSDLFGERLEAWVATQPDNAANMRWVQEQILAIHRNPQANRHKYLDLSGINLKSLPLALFELTKLKELDIHSNPLTSFPQEINKMNLEKLYVDEPLLRTALTIRRTLTTPHLDESLYHSLVEGAVIKVALIPQHAAECIIEGFTNFRTFFWYLRLASEFDEVTVLFGDIKNAAED